MSVSQSVKAVYVLVLLALWGCLSTTVQAAEVSALFSKGSKQVSIYGGNGYAFNNSYLLLGVSGAYYFANGFNVGLSAEFWTGSSPGIQKISPSLTYVFYQVPTVKPYLGVFYQHTYIDGNWPDLESTGGRAGIYLMMNPHTYLGLGGVYESYMNCNETIYNSCSDSYAEISLTFAF